MNQIVKADEAKPRRELIEVIDPIPVLDTSRFEHMQRIATVMARSSLIPESLCTFGTKDNKQDLPYEQVLSNCFLVVNQAVRWGLDPFAVAQCVSVVHGKLCYEGKLVSAVLEAKLGLRLHHHFTGEPGTDEYRIYLSDREFDEATIAELKPGLRKPGFRLFDGSVGEWKTMGNGTPWTPKNHPRMLIYRGTRDWTRIYEPAIMLGVYTPDEMLDLSENARALRSRTVSPEQPSVMQRLQAQQQPEAAAQEREGFNRAHVTRETETLASGQDEAEFEETDQESSAPPADAAAASDPAQNPMDAAAPPSAADTGGDEDGEGDAFETARGETVAPSPSAPSERTTRDCLNAFLRTATDEELTVIERRQTLETMKDWWKAELPSNLDFVRQCLQTCDKVAKGEVKADAARKYLEGLL